MDSRGWPWKKKSSNKSGIVKALEAADPAGQSLALVASLHNQGSKKVNYVQIPLDSYTHLTGLEDEVKKWQIQAKDLEKQLSAAKLEIIAKENLATQHSKVAEEAVSGWEKADAEASILKDQLESVSFLKLTVEDRASHLDGALKECLIQLREAKEDHHEKINEVIITKNKYCDKIKADLEAEISELEQKLARSSTEKAALSRSLQEHSSMLMQINDEKSKVEGENEFLKREIHSLEKEINSLKYEVHVVSKELDIRNEEKNMSVRSAEAANKQYLDSAKKVAKLEAECQKLRGLVKKKLPGPAALAQMKLEVENWEHESGENKPFGKKTTSKAPSLPDIHANNVSPDLSESEYLMKRLLGTEEKMKILRESLATRNSELKSSRDLCDKMISKIRNLETQVQILNIQKNSPRSVFEGATSASSPNSSSESPTISDLSNDENYKIRRKSKNSVTGASIDLMDDFLEMERIADTDKDSIETKIFSPKQKKLAINAQNAYISDQDLVDTVSGFRKFVMYLKSIRLSAHEDLSASLDKFLSREFNLVDLFLSLSRILEQNSELKLITIPKSLEMETSRSDSCHEAEENLDVMSIASCKCSLEIEQLKVEKDDMAKEMARLSQDLESKKLELEGLSKLDTQLTEARSELESSRKWKGLAETQLKCMAESYKLLETRAQDQETNVKVLQERKDSLEAMLGEEKSNHEEALARINDLQDQIQKKESCQACSSVAADFDVKSQKERDIENAAAKLAECQETIFLLGKQLKALHHPQTENESQHKEKLQTNETSAEIKLAQSFQSPQLKSYSHDLEKVEMERAYSLDMRVFDESPLHSYDSSSSPSSGELSQRANKSFCSNSDLVSERSHSGSTRFFVQKGKH